MKSEIELYTEVWLFQNITQNSILHLNIKLENNWPHSNEAAVIYSFLVLMLCPASLDTVYICIEVESNWRKFLITNSKQAF